MAMNAQQPFEICPTGYTITRPALKNQCSLLLMHIPLCALNLFKVLIRVRFLGNTQRTETKSHVNAARVACVF